MEAPPTFRLLFLGRLATPVVSVDSEVTIAFSRLVVTDGLRVRLMLKDPSAASVLTVTSLSSILSAASFVPLEATWSIFW